MDQLLETSPPWLLYLVPAGVCVLAQWMIGKLRRRRMAARDRERMELLDAEACEYRNRSENYAAVIEDLKAQLHASKCKVDTRAEFLQAKLDAARGTITGLEESLQELRQAKLAAESHHAHHRRQHEKVSQDLKQAEQRIATLEQSEKQATQVAKSQTAKLDQIIQILDASGTLAEQLTGEQNGLEE